MFVYTHRGKRRSIYGFPVLRGYRFYSVPSDMIVIERNKFVVYAVRTKKKQ